MTVADGRPRTTNEGRPQCLNGTVCWQCARERARRGPGRHCYVAEVGALHSDLRRVSNNPQRKSANAHMLSAKFGQTWSIKVKGCSSVADFGPNLAEFA